MNSNIEDLFNPLIRRRKVLIPGKGDVPDYSNGTKVRHVIQSYYQCLS